jgi:PKHD-type hydroxylase
MLLRFEGVLSAGDIDRLRELRGSTDHADQAAAIVSSRLWSHPLFTLAVQPRHITTPIVTERTRNVPKLAAIDPAVLGDRNEFRADVGAIIFLNDGEDYAGGDLVFHGPAGEERVRGRSGECIVYPGSTSHGWLAVSSGSIWTVQLWVQSIVRDPRRREILYDVGYSLHLVQLFGPERTADLTRLERCHNNLLRAWAEP